AAEAVDGPGHQDVELAPTGILEHGVEARALVASLGAADAFVAVDLHNLPLATLGNLLQLVQLRVDSLLVSAHAHVDRGAPRLGHLGISLTDGPRSRTRPQREASHSMPATPPENWTINWLAAQPDDIREAILSGLTVVEKAALRYDWRRWARPEQL